jgi:hypothetical protein
VPASTRPAALVTAVLPVVLAAVLVGACGQETGTSAGTSTTTTGVAPAPTTTTSPTSTSTTAAPEPPSLIVAGDSIVYDVAPALEAALEPRGATVTSLVTPSLASESSRTALARGIASARPDVVIVMVGVWERAHVTASGFGLGDPSFPAEYTAEALDPLREQLEAMGSRLLVLGPPHIRVPEDDAEIAQMEAIWGEYAARHPIVDFVDSDSWLLDAGSFVDIDTAGGTPVRLRRTDGLHLCEEGARRIAAGVLEHVGAEPAPGWERAGWVTRFPADECPPVA